MIKEKIRLANKKDSDKILALLNSDSNLHGSKEDRATKSDVKQYLTDNIHRVYVYEYNKKVVAVIIAQFFKIAKYIYFYYIAVDKNYQKKGLASKLIKNLESVAKKEGYYLIELLTKQTNYKMKSFMKKINYKLGDRYLFYYKILK